MLTHLTVPFETEHQQSSLVTLRQHHRRCIQPFVLRWLTSLHQSLTAPKFSDRRRERRVYVKLPIEVRAKGTAYPGLSRDLSANGMGAVVSAALCVGDRIFVKYEHPYGSGAPARAVVRKAVVRQRNGYRYGLEFEIALEI